MKLSSRFFLATIFLLFVIGLSSSYFCFSQVPKKWETISSKSKDFQISIPSDFIVDRQDKNVKLFAYSENAALTVSSEKVARPKEYIRGLEYPKKSSTSYEELEIGDYTVKRFVRETNEGFSNSIFAASNDRYYIITGSAKTHTNPALKQFMFSIRFGGKPLFASAEKLSGEGVGLLLDELQSSEIILEALKRSGHNTSKVQYSAVDEERENFATLFSRGLIVLRNPRPSYTDDARSKNRQGIIRASVEFLKSGQIGVILVDNRLDRGLARNVAEAVKRIKFIPAEIEGKPVDTVRVLEYNFAIY